MNYKISLENIYSGHVSSQWLDWEPTLIVTNEDGISWWKAEDWFVGTGAAYIQLLSTHKDDYIENRSDYLYKLGE